MALVADALPERGAIGDGFAAEFCRSRMYGGRCAGEAHVKAAVDMAGRGDRQRFAGPFVHQGQCFGLGLFAAQGGFGGWQGQGLQRHFKDHAECAQRSGDQSRHVVTGNVFHHLPAETEIRAAAVEDTHAEHEVACRTGVRAPRSRQSGGNATAERCVAAEMRRLETEHLSLFAHCRFDFSERCAGARGNHQFRRFVFDNAAVSGDVERLAGGGVAVKHFAAAAADVQRPFGIRCGADDVRELGDRIGHVRTAAIRGIFRPRNGHACGRTPRSDAVLAPPCPD